MPKPTPKPSPSTYEQMLSRMEYLFDTAETSKDKAAATAYKKALEKKFPNGAPKPVKAGKPKTGVEAKRRALKKVRESYKLPGGGTIYDSYGVTNGFKGAD
jgi:hypothetical protein